MRDFLRNWSQDKLLRGVIKNSSYIFSSNTIAIGLSMLQGIFAARLLGVYDFGVLSGTVMPFVTNINRLLSFRMSELVVKYLGQFTAQDDHQKAAALVKGAAITEGLTSVLAYLVVLLAAPLAARFLAKNPDAAYLFILYGLFLLANLVYESSFGVLQAYKQFNKLALINLIQSFLTAGLILAAFLLHGGLFHILMAYLIGKSFAGIAVSAAAYLQLKQELGTRWWSVSLSLLPPRAELARFAFSTNLQGTVNLVARDSETILIAALRSPTEAGYFRIAQAVINLVMLPIEPFIATIYAEIAHTVARSEWRLTRRLLKRVSAIAGSWTVLAAAGLALIGWWLVPVMYGREYAPAYPALLVLLVGYGVANTVNWNRPLLLALGMPDYPLKVTGLVGAVKTILTLWIVPFLGYIAEAALLSSYFVFSICTIVWRGIREIRLREAADVSQPVPLGNQV